MKKIIDTIKNLLQKYRNVDQAINEAVRQRIRPVLMIALMGSMGLLPAALSTDMGSEIQKPLAIMIVGGVIVCMLLSFSVLPHIFYFVYHRNRLNTKKI
ncbi:MAG: efflux RND transporter permease subunit [Bacteroides sp.]